MRILATKLFPIPEESYVIKGTVMVLHFAGNFTAYQYLCAFEYHCNEENVSTLRHCALRQLCTLMQSATDN